MYLSLNTFLLYTAGFLLSTRLSDAVQCGKWYSNSCLGETDKRYDPDASNAIIDQSDFSKHREGFWIRTYYSYGADGNPMTPSSPGNLLPYVSRFPFMTFENYTYAGSRHYMATYNVHPPLNTTQFPGVCESLQVPIPNFQCGVHGMMLYQGAFVTSTYEKDGSTMQLAGDIVLDPAKDIDYDALVEQKPGKFYGPDSEGKTVVGISNAVAGQTFATVGIFLDQEKTIDSRTWSVYVPTENGDIIAIESLKGIGKRVSEEEWLQALETSMTENNVINPQPLPFTSTCLIECPSEENWCTIDPECSESPYQEPEGEVLPEVIGGFCALGAAILLGLAVTYFKHRLRVQDKRIRSQFARRIAASMGITGAEEALTMEYLMKEFQRIDADNSGAISKDELHDFLMDGKIGSVTEADFNALFIALDKDNSGSVDFVEFVTFMSGCEDELAAAGNLSNEEKIHRLSKAIIRKSRATLNAVHVKDLEDDNDSK